MPRCWGKTGDCAASVPDRRWRNSGLTVTVTVNLVGRGPGERNAVILSARGDLGWLDRRAIRGEESRMWLCMLREELPSVLAQIT